MFEPHRQHTAPARRSYSERRGAFAGVPNTLPPQDLNRSAKLGRVGCSAPKSPRSGSAASLGRARHKTSFYNMLGNQGQTGRGHGRRQCCGSARLLTTAGLNAPSYGLRPRTLDAKADREARMLRDNQNPEGHRGRARLQPCRQNAIRTRL